MSRERVEGLDGPVEPGIALVSRSSGGAYVRDHLTPIAEVPGASVRDSLLMIGSGNSSMGGGTSTSGVGGGVGVGVGLTSSHHSPTERVVSSIGSFKRTFSLFELFGLFAVSFSYAFVFNTLTNIVIPKEVERLAPVRQSVWVGLIMAAGAVCQLATPVVGAWSDKAAQRLPYLIHGSVVVILGIVLFLVVGQVQTVMLLFAAHIVTTIGLSIQYAMVTALLNDHVADEQVGKGSGTMAILAIFGSGAGYAMFATSTPLQYSYLAYILATVFCLGICVIHVPAEAGAHNKRGAEVVVHVGSPIVRPKDPWKPHTTFESVLSAIGVPVPSRHPDFFFACLGRCLFNAGLAGQVYLVYFVRDILNSTDAVKDTSLLSVAALIGSIVMALPSGIISDRVGKKVVIYIAIVVCMTSLICFTFVPSVAWLPAIGFFFGAGNVAYLSVDYALGVQALPKRHSIDTDEHHQVPADAAKDLGVFAMSATVGQLLGQVVYGAVLDQFASTSARGTTHFGHVGFVAIYTVGAGCFLLSGLSTSFIRGVK